MALLNFKSRHMHINDFSTFGGDDVVLSRRLINQNSVSTMASEGCVPYIKVQWLFRSNFKYHACQGVPHVQLNDTLNDFELMINVSNKECKDILSNMRNLIFPTLGTRNTSMCLPARLLNNHNPSLKRSWLPLFF